MKKTYLGRIFVYDTDKKRLGEVKEYFEIRGFELFGTDNIYQLLNYARELNTDVARFLADYQEKADKIFDKTYGILLRKGLGR